MRCGRCEADNRAGRRFCAACAAPLAAPCAACAFVNEPGERFCGGCGAAVTGAAATPTPPPAAAPRQGERRTVTVLFADLAGYTRLSSTLDPEQVNALLERFFDTVDGAVLAFGGAIDKHIGDNVMAVFGAPIAHDNDPERAVRAALEIQRRVEALDDELPVPLRVHVGLATGEVVASPLGSQHHQEYTVTGDAVNLAARLQDKATGGETMVADGVRRATEHLARFEAVGELPIKGLAAPVAVWKLLGLRTERAAPRERALIGRRAEVARLEAELRRTRDTGQGTAILLRGEAGIGKTRLIAELRGRAAALGYADRTVLVLDFGGGGGHGVAAATALALCGLDTAAGAAARHAALTRAATAVAADDRPALADLLELGVDDAGRAVYAAMTGEAREAARRRVLAALLVAAAAAQPLLLVVEDLHWADPATLALVGALAGATAACRALVVLTTRIEGDPLDASWRTTAYAGPLLALELRPLSATEAHALAGGFIATDEVVASCVARAGGNPLFLEQLLEHTADGATAAVPATIHSLVLSRVDRLPPSARRALQAAAVIGQRFTADAVAAVLDEPGWHGGDLAAAHLIRPVDDGWLFHHALIRDGVYASLTRGPRATLHRAAAAWYASRAPVLAAQHLDRADDEGAAAAYAVAAAAEAAALRVDHAIELAARGRALARTAADRHRLAALHGELAQLAGRGAVAVAAWSEAVAFADDPTARCRAWIGVAAGHRLLSHFAPAFEALDQAEPLAHAGDLGHELAWIDYHRGSLWFAKGDQGEACAAHRRALATAQRIGDRELEARAISGLADSDFATGAMALARDGFARCLALCAQLGLERYALPNRLMHAMARFWLGELEAALALWEETTAAAERVGDRNILVLAHTQLAYTRVHAGDLGRALPHAERAVAIATETAALRYEVQARCMLAEVLAWRGHAGDRATALACVERALKVARGHGMGFSGATACGTMYWLSPDPAVRQRALDDGRAVLASGTMVLGHVMFHKAVLDGALDRGEWDLIEPHAAALATAAGPGDTAYGWLADRARLLAAWGSGPRTAALPATVEAVIERARRVGADPRLPAEVRALATSTPTT